jgi:hypothetical protein
MAIKVDRDLEGAGPLAPQTQSALSISALAISCNERIDVVIGSLRRHRKTLPIPPNRLRETAALRLNNG